MKNVSEKYRRKVKKRSMFYINFFRKSCYYKTMSRNMHGTTRTQMEEFSSNFEFLENLSKYFNVY